MRFLVEDLDLVREFLEKKPSFRVNAKILLTGDGVKNESQLLPPWVNNLVFGDSFVRKLLENDLVSQIKRTGCKIDKIILSFSVAPDASMDWVV